MFKKTQEAGCQGDAYGYFTHVDEPRLVEFMVREGRKDSPQKPSEVASEDLLSNASKTGAQMGTQQWRESIEKDSDDCPICRADMEGNPAPTGTSGTLIVDIPGNGMQVWRMVGYRAAGSLDPVHIETAASALFDVVLHPFTNPIGWTALAAIATGRLLLATKEMEQQTRWKLGFARDVAKRHMGESVMPPWPDDSVWEGFNSDQRLAVVAHLVQGAADAAHELVPVAVALAGETLETDSQSSPERAAELLGAVGRAEAAVGRLGPSVFALRQAAQSWHKLGKEDQTSYAASELLRVSALIVLEARAEAHDCLQHPETNPLSNAHVRLAEARADVLLGNWHRALARLDPDSED